MKRGHDIDWAVVNNFNPTMRYTMTRETLRELLLKTPIPAFWHGGTYRIRSKSLGAGVYEVWTVFDAPPGKPRFNGAAMRFDGGIAR